MPDFTERPWSDLAAFAREYHLVSVVLIVIVTLVAMRLGGTALSRQRTPVPATA